MQRIDYPVGKDVRDPGFADRAVTVERRQDGSLLLRSPLPRPAPDGHCGVNFCAALRDRASTAPDRTFLAERGPDGAWQRLSYAEAWARASAIGAWLVDHGRDPERPVAILSGNTIAHALFSFGAMMVGRPVAPVSPSYSLLPEARERLRHVAALLQPEFVFAQSPAHHGSAREVPELAAATWIAAGPAAGCLDLAELERARAGAAFDLAFGSVRADSIAKILFTSGSTGAPKGVINSHGGLAAAIAASGAIVNPGRQPPVLLDWLPWHHTMGGNQSLHSVLRDAGTLYIDDGRPTRDGFGRTLRNLAEIAPTSLQNVPIGFPLLVEALEGDSALRDRFFSRLRYLSYAGAGLAPEIWVRMQALAVAATGQNIAFVSGYGATEAGPGIATLHWFREGTGVIGLPLPGVEMKLLPAGDRYEARIRGDNVTPGYYRQPELTASAFDAEGFYRLGDAVQFVDPDDPAQGLRFAGRLAENFKLANGSWVAVGELRAALLAALAPLVDDLVVAGQDRTDIRVLLWPSLAGRQCAPQDLQDRIDTALAGFNAGRTAASHRIAGHALLDSPPSLAAGELTDKGSVNQRAALRHRAAEVESLYAGAAGAAAAARTTMSRSRS